MSLEGKGFDDADDDFDDEQQQDEEEEANSLIVVEAPVQNESESGLMVERIPPLRYRIAVLLSCCLGYTFMSIGSDALRTLQVRVC